MMAVSEVNMKKILYSLGIIIVISLVALLYTYATAFQVRNVESMSILDQEYTFDLEDETTQLLIKKLQVLKQYEQVKSIDSIVSETLILDMKYSQEKTFEISLNHDFTSVYITDIKKEIIYEMDDDFVTWLYMLPPFESIYTYKTPLRHDLVIDDKKVYGASVDYFYMTADKQWHAQSIEEDTEPYVMIITEPNVLFTVRSDVGMNEVMLKVTKDDKILYEKPLEEGIYQPVDNGQYIYEVTSSWQDTLYYGHESTSFIVEAQYPPVFTVSSDIISQGEFIIIKGSRIFDPESLYIDQSYMEGLSFEKNGDLYECLIPSTYYTTPDVYTLNYGVGQYEYELTFEVKTREFNLQYLTVDEKTTQTTQTAEAYAEYNKYYKPALLKNVYQSEVSHLTNQSFILPVKGRITTEFGVQRYVNNKPTSYHHSGLDIANDRGTEVISTYDGEVVLSMSLLVTGNTVVISHGNGIFSSYLHMDSLNVEEGDTVKAGEKIGTIGSTGFSTGPHLHFTISYYKMNLEPGYFIYGEPVTYENYKILFNN